MSKAARAAVMLVLLLSLGMTSAVAIAATTGIPSAMARSGAGADAGLTSIQILHPLPGSWPVYSGDYSGRRYSPLNQINRDNIGQLRPAWISEPLPTGAGEGVQIGGDPRGEAGAPNTGTLRGSPLMVNGVLYLSNPNNVWAMNARTGAMIWRFHWKYRGGTTIGNRGVAMWGDYLFVETPDNYLVSLDSKTGKERWHVAIEPYELQFFSTPAPMVVGNHVITGTGSDHEQAGRMQSFDPVTGKRQWVLYTVPVNPGDPGLSTWKNLDAARHGGAQTWAPGSYDPETNLFIVGTSGPNPEYYPGPRNGPTGGDTDLYGNCMIAVDVETGKMKWYYQSSPGETHDFDSAQTPVLADIIFDGRTRKVAITAHRNGYFFVIDRITGEHLLTSKLSATANWAYGFSPTGQPLRSPQKDSSPDGALVSPTNGGAANWPPPAYNPDTGLFYVSASETFAEYYATEADPRGSIGLGGKTELAVPGGGTSLKAVDPKTGKIVWEIDYPTIDPTGYASVRGSGVLTTAGGLVFASGLSAGMVARDASTGKPLWHSGVQISNAPETYMLDGKQYILVGIGDTVTTYTLP